MNHSLPSSAVVAALIAASMISACGPKKIPMTRRSVTVAEPKFLSEKCKLELALSYGGGCGDHKFKLIYPKQCVEGEPQKCPLEVVHFSDDQCEAYISDQKRRFKVMADKPTEYEIENKHNTVSVLVDRACP